MSYLHSDDAFDYPVQHPQLPDAETAVPEGYAQTDLLHFEGIVDPADDKPIGECEVVLDRLSPVACDPYTASFHNGA